MFADILQHCLWPFEKQLIRVKSQCVEAHAKVFQMYTLHIKISLGDVQSPEAQPCSHGNI